MAELDLRDIHLSYPVLQASRPSLRQDLKAVATGGIIRRWGRRSVEVTALNGVSLSARDGDRIGLVGVNGAGKTTLLKVIAGIYKPQAGRVYRDGRIASVISPAVGLEASLNGYDNILTIGLLSGLSRAAIKERLPEIEAFTELGEFLNLPVSTYSAGMKTRLAFAVATSLEPEILVTDENLGTGDRHFIDRARARMEAMMDRSSIIVLATHSQQILKRLCNRAILLHHGELVADGPVEDVLDAYQRGSEKAALPAVSKAS